MSALRRSRHRSAAGGGSEEAEEIDEGGDALALRAAKLSASSSKPSSSSKPPSHPQQQQQGNVRGPVKKLAKLRLFGKKSRRASTESASPNGTGGGGDLESSGSNAEQKMPATRPGDDRLPGTAVSVGPSGEESVVVGGGTTAAAVASSKAAASAAFAPSSTAGRPGAFSVASEQQSGGARKAPVAPAPAAPAPIVAVEEEPTAQSDEQARSQARAFLTSEMELSRALELSASENTTPHDSAGSLAMLSSSSRAPSTPSASRMVRNDSAADVARAIELSLEVQGAVVGEGAKTMQHKQAETDDEQQQPKRVDAVSAIGHDSAADVIRALALSLEESNDELIASTATTTAAASASAAHEHRDRHEDDDLAKALEASLREAEKEKKEEEEATRTYERLRSRRLQIIDSLKDGSYTGRRNAFPSSSSSSFAPRESLGATIDRAVSNSMGDSVELAPADISQNKESKSTTPHLTNGNLLSIMEQSLEFASLPSQVDNKTRRAEDIPNNRRSSSRLSLKSAVTELSKQRQADLAEQRRMAKIAMTRDENRPDDAYLHSMMKEALSLCVMTDEDKECANRRRRAPPTTAVRVGVETARLALASNSMKRAEDMTLMFQACRSREG